MKINQTQFHNYRTKLSRLFAAGGMILIAGFALPADRADARDLASSSGHRAIDWSTYGFNLERTGENPFETVLTPATVGGLHELWSFDLGAVTIMQPVLAAGVVVNASPKDLVYMGAEHGDLYAIDAASGTMVWHRNLGSVQTGCTDFPDGVFGVSGSPFLDRPNNRMFVVGGDGKMYALDLSTGATLPGWPVVVTPTPFDDHVWSAVTVHNGIAYAETAGMCFPTYRGKLVAIDIRTQKRLAVFLPAGPNVIGGGIWGTGGVSIDPATGHVFAGTGNAETDPEYYRYCDQVVELSPELRVLGSHYPGFEGEDRDFGSTPVLYQPPGCPPLLAAKNKSGALVIYERGNVSAGPTQRLQMAHIEDWEFQGLAAWSEVTHMLYVSNSSDSTSNGLNHGMVAFFVGANCQLRLAWQTTVGPHAAVVSSPTVAGGVVYYGDGPDSKLLAFDAVTGTQLWSSGSTISGGIYGTPMVVNGRVFVGGWDHKLHVFGL